MSEEMISAEIEPRPGETARAAQALQRLGFRVLHTGRTISVQGGQRLWESTFSVSFKQQRKRTSAELGHELSFPRPEVDRVAVPRELEDLIASIAFVEPPEWFSRPS